jgi:hypothetical protein
LALVKRNSKAHGLNNETSISTPNQGLEKAETNQNSDQNRLADVPLDERKKEAKKPLFLTRYE